MSLVQNPEPTLDRWTQRAFAFGVILLAWAIASVLGLSALGWQCTRPRLLALLLAVVGLAVVVAWKLPSPRLEYRRDARVVWWLAALSLVAWVVQFVRVFHLVLERPVYDWDGLYYHLPAGAREVSLEILEGPDVGTGAQASVVTFDDFPTEAGSHRFVWDLRYPGPDVIEGSRFSKEHQGSAGRKDVVSQRTKIVDGRAQRILAGAGDFHLDRPAL